MTKVVRFSFSWLLLLGILSGKGDSLDHANRLRHEPNHASRRLHLSHFVAATWEELLGPIRDALNGNMEQLPPHSGTNDDNNGQELGQDLAGHDAKPLNGPEHSNTVGGGVGGTIHDAISGSLTKKNDWEFCTANSECANNCCSTEYSNDGRTKCTPGGCHGGEGPVKQEGGGGGDGGGSVKHEGGGVDGVVQNGRGGDSEDPVKHEGDGGGPVEQEKGAEGGGSVNHTKGGDGQNGQGGEVGGPVKGNQGEQGLHIGAIGGEMGTAGKGGKGEWEFCSLNSECANSCCTDTYSDDRRLKCTPNGC